MSHDFSSALSDYKERAKDTVILKTPKIVHFFAEGSGVLSKMSAVIARDWETTTGIPFGLAVHVCDSVSGGSSFVAGIRIPHPKDPTRPLYSSDDLIRLFDEDSAAMFSQKPLRMFNLAASNAINYSKLLFDPYENAKDRMRIQRLKEYADSLYEELPDDKKIFAAKLKDVSSRRWLSAKDKEVALRLCKKLTTNEDGNPKKKIKPYKPSETTIKLAEEIGLLLSHRSTAHRGWLKIAFTRAGLGSLNFLQTKIGHLDQHYYNAALKQAIFIERMGEDRVISNLMGSNYFAAFSPTKQSTVLMYCQRHNFLDLRADAPGESSDPHLKVWDANMATSANPFAYAPHIMEDGTVAIDLATIYTPIVSLAKTLKHTLDVGHDLGVISLTFSTGHVTRDNMSADEIFAFYKNQGQIHDGALHDYKASVTTSYRDAVAAMVGKENVFVFSPRMSWKDLDEMQVFPSTDITDSSAQNMVNVEHRGLRYLRDNRPKVSRLWQVLIDNLYLLGQIDKPKFEAITQKIGIKAEIDAALSGQNVVQMPVHEHIHPPRVA